MAEKYAKYKQANATGAQSGYVNNAYISLVEWITTEQVPAANVAMGDRFKIATAHEWAEGMGAIPCYVSPKSIEGNGEYAGDQAAKIKAFKPKIKLHGDNPALLELTDNIMNKEVIIWVVKSDGQVVQYGNGSKPCQLDTGNIVGPVTGTGGAGDELTFETFYKAFYTPGVAGITEYGD